MLGPGCALPFTSGPHKATHLSMCDRTFSDKLNIADFCFEERKCKVPLRRLQLWRQ